MHAIKRITIPLIFERMTKSNCITLKSPTRSNYRAKRGSSLAKIAAFVASAGDNGSVVFRHTSEAGRYVFVSPSLLIGSSGWRTTNFDANGPEGNHHEFPTRIAAIKAVAGECFTEAVPGPALYRSGDYVFERIRTPESIGKQGDFKRLSMIVAV